MLNHLSANIIDENRSLRRQESWDGAKEIDECPHAARALGRNQINSLERKAEKSDD